MTSLSLSKRLTRSHDGSAEESEFIRPKSTLEVPAGRERSHSTGSQSPGEFRVRCDFCKNSFLLSRDHYHRSFRSPEHRTLNEHRPSLEPADGLVSAFDGSTVVASTTNESSIDDKIRCDEPELDHTTEKKRLESGISSQDKSKGLYPRDFSLYTILVEAIRGSNIFTRFISAAFNETGKMTAEGGTQEQDVTQEICEPDFSVYALIIGALLGSVNLNRLLSRYFDASDKTTTLELFLAIAMFAFAATGYYQQQLERGNLKQDRALFVAVGPAIAWAIARDGDHVVSFLGALPPCLWAALAASTVLHEME